MKILFFLVFSLFIVQDLCKDTKRDGMKKRKTSPVEASITQKLTKELKPFFLDVINESYLHNVQPGSPEYFRVIVVSDSFNDKTLLERHKIVNSLLAEELRNSIHAFSLLTKTPNEWTEMMQDK